MATTSAAGSAQSLSESRAEALQALLDSLEPGSQTSEGGKLNSVQVRRISDRLGELLGEEASTGIAQRRNEKGELVNEEGLPIIDIMEPIPATEGSSNIETVPAPQDLDIIPLWALSPVEKARRRTERDRILDLLEEEERQQQGKDEEDERERFRVELEKRKKAAQLEMDALKKAREMQKKMGKALLRNLAEARDREEQEKRAVEEAEKQAREERKKLKPKKSVTFADLPPDHEYQPANNAPMPPLCWGDVTPAKLQSTGKSALLTKSQMDKGPMRMNVVERVPGSSRVSRSPPPPTSQQDSDDESDIGSPVPADSDEGEIIRSDQSDTDDSPPHQVLDDSDESDFGVPEDSEPIQWDDDGYDFARHQREIALAYYEKRATVGAEALAAMRNHDHTKEEQEHEWDRPVVPLEATLTSAPPKPPVSRFKTSLGSGSSSLPSHSLGSSVLPASQSTTLKEAVRLGKLENGNLVGGEDGESDDDMETAAKEMLEMLKKGEVVNVGPNLPSNPVATTATIGSSMPDKGAQLKDPTTSVAPSTPQSQPSKGSRFKMSFGTERPAQAPVSPGPVSPGSSLATPVTVTERSSPKFPSREGTPIAVPTRTSHLARSSQNAPTKLPAQMPSMIVDSRSFPIPGLVDSPSFPGPSNVSGPSPSPAFQSVILESPSFQSPTSTLIGSAEPSPTPSPLASTRGVAGSMSASVLERRPVVATNVRESSGVISRSEGTTPVKERKVSRFLAERM